MSCPLGSSAVRCECDTSKNHYKTNVFGHMPSHVPRQCVPSVVLVGFLLFSGRMRHLKKTLQNQWKINFSRHESHTVFENEEKQILNGFRLSCSLGSSFFRGECDTSKKHCKTNEKSTFVDMDATRLLESEKKAAREFQIGGGSRIMLQRRHENDEKTIGFSIYLLAGGAKGGGVGRHSTSSYQIPAGSPQSHFG